MIIEMVLFDLPKDADRNSVMALYEKTAARWAANADLIEKYYYFDQTTGEGGGVYVGPIARPQKDGMVRTIARWSPTSMAPSREYASSTRSCTSRLER
jgi:hypothetical protein